MHLPCKIDSPIKDDVPVAPLTHETVSALVTSGARVPFPPPRTPTALCAACGCGGTSAAAADVLLGTVSCS